MTLNAMFNENNNDLASGSRGLAGTAQLTAIANDLKNSIIKEVNDNFQKYADMFEASKFDHGKMDEFLKQFINYEEQKANLSFLEAIEEDVINGMLSSQQSKRSRAKGKLMTLDNYSSLMTGAIAENLIREYTGKTKSAGGNRRALGAVEFSEEYLAELTEDQDKLRKELRNVQSKKSIMKSKIDFDENSERWQSLLNAEQQLKERRVTTGRTTVVKVDETKDAVKELLGDVDFSTLKADEAKELLAKVSEISGQ